MSKELDLSLENIAKINDKVQAQNKDLYAFLKDEFSDISVEDRLKYLSTILNDHFEDYEFDNKDEYSVDGYIVKRFYPKGIKS